MSRDWLDKNFYAALGVPQNATKEEIKKAYKKLARDNHPDLNPDNAEAERKFKEVSEAHAVLGDDRKRQEYDQIRTMGSSGFGGFSSQVNNYLLNELPKTPKILNFFMNDKFIDQSDIEDQYNLSGISSKKIYEKLTKFLK